MKTMKMIASVLFSAAAIAVVNAQTVPSVNAAGYIKVTCEPSKFQFVQNPFNSFDGSTYHLSQIIGTSLPELSKVFIWNENTQRFDIFQYDEGSWIPSDPLIARGSGFFIQASTFGTASSYDVFLFGEVPGATTNAQTTKALPPGFSAAGFPYPVQTTLGTSGLTAATQDGDKVFLWDAANQRYVIAVRYEDPGFEWDNPNLPIPPGAAFFIRRGATGSYVSSVPYTWPNN